VDSPSELLQAVQQHPLSDVLRDHQRVRVLRLQTVEPDRHELAIAVADAELRSLDPESCQAIRDSDPLEHLEGPGVYDSGPRRVRPLRLLIDHRDVTAMSRQRRSDGQPHRAGTNH
jgi:hypothetical protein